MKKMKNKLVLFALVAGIAGGTWTGVVMPFSLEEEDLSFKDTLRDELTDLIKYINKRIAIYEERIASDDCRAKFGCVKLAKIRKAFGKSVIRKTANALLEKLGGERKVSEKFLKNLEAVTGKINKWLQKKVE